MRPVNGPPDPTDAHVRRITDVDLHRLLDLRLVSIEEPVAVEMPVAPAALNSSGNLHGGAIATLIDVSAGLAAAIGSGFDPGRNSIVTADLHVRYLGRPKTDTVRATSHVLRAGRQLVVVECRVTDGDDNTIAVADFSMMIVPHRAPLPAATAAADPEAPDI